MGPSHEMHEYSMTKVILFCHVDKQEQVCRREGQSSPRKQTESLLAGQYGEQLSTRFSEDPAF